jgi:prevent-host-death family protein
MIEPLEVSASDAKNGFGRVLEYVARDGGVTITRRRTPVAVVIPVETYARLAAAEANSLDTLTAEFDALLGRLQAPGAAAAMQRAFELAPGDLGEAAVRGAARRREHPRTEGTDSRRRAAKTAPKRRSRAKGGHPA